MDTTTKSPVMIYTEQTPDPESLKFVTNKMLHQGEGEFNEKSLADEWSPLASALFDLPYVKAVFICNNFVKIRKENSFDWEEVRLQTKEFIKSWIQEDKTIIKDGFAEASDVITTNPTPNPQSLKFITKRKLFSGTADFRERTLADEWSPLAQALFDLPFVKGVYISGSFVSITKEMNYAWEDISGKIKEVIKSWLVEDKTVISEGFAEAMIKLEEEKGIGYQYSPEEAEVVQKIKSLLDEYVKPQVQMDGGNIEFNSFKDGVVSVLMQGACSGCPSSTMTLKSGIEGMLKRMVPEVKEVVAEMG